MYQGKRILAFAGSIRTGSHNRRLLAIAAAAARAAGAEVTEVDLAEFPMPLYNGDLEAEHGLPENAVRLKELFMRHRGLLIASPEYNSSYSPLLKNTLDWVSRSAPGEPTLACYTNKIAGLVSASPGALGGLRGLMHLRQLLGNIRVVVIPEQMAIAGAGDAFDEHGNLVDPAKRSAVEHVGARLAQMVVRLAD